eukprot:GHVL01008615.1.p2 GENE.GHVL01008615.1~~GHVL01008615.1.p2  ORF type:complete len:113 (-),score=18.00 GHVL01008615.1:108-446(-)
MAAKIPAKRPAATPPPLLDEEAPLAADPVGLMAVLLAEEALDRRDDALLARDPEAAGVLLTRELRSEETDDATEEYDETATEEADTMDDMSTLVEEASPDVSVPEGPITEGS